jgi:hypothetical protein
VNGLPLRTLLAGLIGFALAFCNQAKIESPRAAVGAAEFRATCSTSTVRTAPLPDLPRPDVQRPRCRKSKGRSDKWAWLWTVEGELEFETPTYRPPKAGTRLLFRLQTAGANPIGPASGARSGSPFTHSSQGTRTAREP